MLHLALKAFRPGRLPFPVMHVDTGHNFDEVLADPRRAGRRGRGAAGRRQGAGRHRCRPGRRDHPVAQPDADRHAAARHPREQVRRGVRRRPPRRGEGARQGAGVQLPRRVRPVGPEGAAARAVEPLQRPAPQGRAHPGVPAVQLDRVRHLVLHRRREDQAAVDLLRAPPPGVRARRDAAGRAQVPAAAQGRGGRREDRAVPHRRRRHLHRLRGIDWRARCPR